MWFCHKVRPLLRSHLNKTFCLKGGEDMERSRVVQASQTEGRKPWTRRDKAGVGLMGLGLLGIVGSLLHPVVVNEVGQIRSSISRDVDEMVPPADHKKLAAATAAVDAYIKEMKAAARRGEAGGEVQAALAIADTVDQRRELTRRLEGERDVSGAANTQVGIIFGGMVAGAIVMAAGAILTGGGSGKEGR